VRVAHQDVPASRAKPWGTAHAVISAESEVEGSFVVLNADDSTALPPTTPPSVFSRPSRGERRRRGASSATGLRDTVWGNAGVNRAVCHMKDGWLTGTEEVIGIVPHDHAFSGQGLSGH